MSKYGIIRAKKHSNFGTIRNGIKHQLRESPTPNADASRQHLNLNLVDDSAEAMSMLKDGLKDVKAQKHAVKAIEYMITCSKDSDIDHDQYLMDALHWLQQKHGQENVFFWSIQNDETTPHLSVFAAPVVEVQAKTVNGKTKTGKDFTRHYDAHKKLSAKTFLGGRDLMIEMQDQFHAEVSSKFDLDRGQRGSKRRHEDIKALYGRDHRQAEKEAQIDKKLQFLDRSIEKLKETFPMAVDYLRGVVKKAKLPTPEPEPEKPKKKAKVQLNADLLNKLDDESLQDHLYKKHQPK